MKERMEDINPDIRVNARRCFFTEENSADFDFSLYDYVVDAVDTVSAKIALVERCRESGRPIISSMGAGNKLDPTAFEVCDIQKTSVCPLAKVMRTELRKRGINHLKVVYSKEQPIKPQKEIKTENRRFTPGSVAFVPSAVGLIIAGEVIRDIYSGIILIYSNWVWKKNRVYNQHLSFYPL